MSIQNPNQRFHIDGEAGERRTKVDDRLSSLPDDILHHVLSFLEATNFAVQTSVLSRRWRSLWEHVPRLVLNTESFTGSSFARYVDGVLSRRADHGCNVDAVWYFHSCPSLEEELFHRVVKFAASHGCREFVVVPYEDGFDNSLFAPFANSNLRVLGLRLATLHSGFGSCGFGMLTTLELNECFLPCDTAADLDPFVNFPCLENLILSSCLLEGQCGFKISGPRLVKLLIHYLDCSELEIFAPQLKFFDYLVYWRFPRLFNLRLPSLDHAEISVHGEYHDERNKEEMKACYISLLQGLHNASSLGIDFDLFQLLCKNCELLEHQSYPFTRLKSLTVPVYSIDCPYRLPYHVISYFLSGSSTHEPAYIEFG